MATAYDIANTFLFLDQENDGEGITHLKLQKLVYYAQGFFLAIFDKPLFEESIEAWTHGPVVPAVYNIYKDRGRELLSVSEDFTLDILSNDEKDLIEEVYEVFGQFSAWKLRNMTHEEPTWLNHENCADEITHTELKDYFKTRIN